MLTNPLHFPCPATNTRKRLQEPLFTQTQKERLLEQLAKKPRTDRCSFDTGLEKVATYAGLTFEFEIQEGKRSEESERDDKFGIAFRIIFFKKRINFACIFYLA